MSACYVPAQVPVYPVPVPTALPPPAPRYTYLCPYGGTPLTYLPTNQWYCPYHGTISKWKFRFI